MMTTNQTSRETLAPGKLLRRWDSPPYRRLGEGVSATPRRGSLLYKRILGLVACCVVAGGAQATLLKESLSEGDGEALVVSGTAFTAEEKEALTKNEVVELWKTGSATLVSEDIGAFTGIIRIKGGIMQVASAAGLGTTAGATYVEKGATLQITADFDPYEPLFLAGDGADHWLGALRIDVKGPELCGRTTLTDDALINCYGEWNLKGTFDMGGKTVTMTNETHQCVFYPSSILNAGHILVTGGTIWIHQGVMMDQGPEHTLTLTNKANMSLYWYTGAKSIGNWTINYRTKTTGNGIYGTNTGTNNPTRWYGPIIAGEGCNVKVSPSKNTCMDFYGPISGKGGFMRSGESDTIVRFYGTNTFEGSFVCGSSNNRFYSWFMHPQASPSVSTDKISADTANAWRIFLPLRDEDAPADYPYGWDSDALGAAFKARNNSAGPLRCVIEPGKTFVYTNEISASSGTPFGFSGGGQVKITGDFVGRQPLSLVTEADGTQVLVKGDLTDSTRKNQYGRINFESGIYRVENVNPWFTSKDEEQGLAAFDISVAGYKPEAILTLGPGVVMQQTLNRATETFYLGWSSSSANRYGTLEMLEGAVFTNKLSAGGYYNNHAAVYQRGGIMYLTNGGGNDGYLGDSGYGFFEKTGGTLGIRGWTRMGATRSGVGIFYGKSDWNINGGSFCVAASGTGLVYQTAGRINVSPNISDAIGVCNGNYAYDTKRGGLGIITLSGATAELKLAYDSLFLADISYSTAILNVRNGGTFAGPRIRSSGTNAVSTATPITISNACSYVNFEGGILKPTGGTTLLFGSGEKAPTRVTAFAGGVIVDTDGKNVTWNTDLKAPEGKGVTAIALPEDFAATGYMGAPFVTITGDGTGATAVAEFDSTTKTVTGITVTSPGWNYTRAHVSLSRGGKTETVEWDVTPQDNNLTGGITKRGEGTLTLSGTNTYAGVTAVEGGTLKLACAEALPSGSAIQLKGGTFDPNGFAAALSQEFVCDVAALRAAGTCGTLAGVSTLAGKTIRFENGDTLNTAPDCTIKLLSFESAYTGALPATAGYVPPKWRLVKHGSDLVLKAMSGTTVIVR